MPNKEHEIPLKIIRNAPELVVPLLRDAVGYDLPEHTEVVLTSAECTDSTPRTYTPDGAVLLRAGTENALAVVVEQNPGTLLAPRVRVFYSAKSRTHLLLADIDLAATDGRERIVGIESPEKWGFRELEKLWLP